jgi:hypothetical protein
MDGAHQLTLGGERHLADPRQPGVERGVGESGLPRRDEQRALGRVALHHPASVALVHGGVVRAVRDRERPLELIAEGAIYL